MTGPGGSAVGVARRVPGGWVWKNTNTYRVCRSLWQAVEEMTNAT